MYENEQSVNISFQQKAWRLISCTTSWVFPAALQVLMRTDQIWLVSSNRCRFLPPCIWIKFILLGYRFICLFSVVSDAINERLSKGSDNILDTSSWEVSVFLSIPFPKYCALYLDCVKFLSINEFLSCALGTWRKSLRTPSLFSLCILNKAWAAPAQRNP